MGSGAFVGAKGALFCDGQVLCYLRDDHEGLPWRAYWDLPGGGREGDEAAEACFLRELDEEFGLALAPERLLYRRVLTFTGEAPRHSVFFAGRLETTEIEAIRFGSEGQHWRMMEVSAFVVHEKAVPHLAAETARAFDAIRSGQFGKDG